MNCVGFKMSINLCLVRSSGRGPSCNNALGCRAALPGRREPKLRWQTFPEQGWQVGQAPRLNFCFLWTVNSWLVNFDVTVLSASSGWAWAGDIYVQLYLCAAFSALQFLLSQEESPIPLYWNYWDSHEGGDRTRVPTDGWWPSMHQPLALTCSWEFRIYWSLLCPVLVWTSSFRLQ